MLRKPKKYAINEILSKVAKNADRVDFDGDLVKMNSQRYRLFKENGVKCVKCDIEGLYFIKEKSNSEYPYHFNLYGVKDDGTEVLMTKDHIVPKSKGGANKLSNYQVMCANCNLKKGDS